MRKPWERNPNSAGLARQVDGRLLKIEALEDRRLLTATAAGLPHPYFDLVPDAVVKARDFLISNPTLTGDVESWFAEEDQAEAASGIGVTLVELHIPQNVIPAGMSVELVEEMMEELIEDSTPVRDVVEVIFNFGASAAIDARLANSGQANGNLPAPSTSRVASASESEPQDADSAAQRAIDEATIAVEESENVDENEIDDSPAPDSEATAASFQELAKSASDKVADATAPQLLNPPADARELITLPVQEHPSLLEHLRSDLQAVDQSIEAMLDDLQVLRRDIAEWLDKPPMPLWAKVALGTAATLVSWRELRRWRERRNQPDEEAVDWIFLHSLDHERAAS